MRKDQVDFVNATVWIPDSKTPNGIAEIPLTPLAVEALKSQMLNAGPGPFLFRAYATRLSAGGVADEWVTQLLRQGDAKIFKKYSQMKLQMKREALEKMNRQANEMSLHSGTATIQ
jgi:integrase